MLNARGRVCCIRNVADYPREFRTGIHRSWIMAIWYTVLSDYPLWKKESEVYKDVKSTLLTINSKRYHQCLLIPSNISNFP